MTATSDGRPEHPPVGTTSWVAMGLGGAIVAFGLVGLLTAEGNGLTTFVPWFAGGALALDLLVVPAAAAVGAVGRRVVPEIAWPPVRAALVATATLVVFAAPLVADLGGRPDNASLRPRSYGSGLLLAVAACWLVALATVAARVAVHRRRP